MLVALRSVSTLTIINTFVPIIARWVPSGYGTFSHKYYPCHPLRLHVIGMLTAYRFPSRLLFHRPVQQLLKSQPRGARLGISELKSLHTDADSHVAIASTK
jgi:hypothetical protein